MAHQHLMTAAKGRQSRDFRGGCRGERNGATTGYSAALGSGVIKGESANGGRHPFGSNDAVADSTVPVSAFGDLFSGYLRHRITNMAAFPVAVNEIWTDISCIRSASEELLTATLLMDGAPIAPPLIDQRPDINLLTSARCSLKSAVGDWPSLRLTVREFGACGVEECVKGERWLCVTVRFPRLAGLRLLEDSVVRLRCLPKERRHALEKQLTLQAPRLDRLPIASYSGATEASESGLPEFDVQLLHRGRGQFRFTPVHTGYDSVHLGDEMELRTTVRDRDGWRYSRLTGLVLERVPPDGEVQPSDIVPLVLSDGCANREYKLLAPENPSWFENDPLVVRFSFRAFSFQGVTSDDLIRVTVRIAACRYYEPDCRPPVCGPGTSTRVRRSVDSEPAALSSSRQSHFRVVAHAVGEELPISSPVGLEFFYPAALLALSAVLALSTFVSLLLTLATMRNTLKSLREAFLKPRFRNDFEVLEEKCK
ncbi:hypothetical protein FJT64_016789 [Amphibalanus amphitrite]|uniref:ZP domain-containing protein n=1 Tax=Amphibalanus amphitrite TaxID=1232801 RepID=A0A6A4WZP8_AMPAM|nr:hypothetical protein FJT64_016789 [Amphibalanus amphitrite]